MRYLIFSVFIFISSFAYALNVDINRLTVSGLSAGAYMAVQMAVSNSSRVVGLGVIEGGPYLCAQGSLEVALNNCMETPSPTLNLQGYLKQAQAYSSMGLIDDLKLVAPLKAFFFLGANDKVITAPLVRSNIEFFSALGVSESQIKYVDNILAGHAFVTVEKGNDCTTERTAPFISRCGYDTVGHMFKALVGKLEPRGSAALDHFFKFSQATDEFARPFLISMADDAAAYVPEPCRNGERCSVHIALHGCNQTRLNIGDQFILDTGYAEWADTNHMVVLFPQAFNNQFVGNPKGCWDWWGYSSDLYATKKAPQIKLIMQLVDKLATANKSELSPLF